MLRTFFAAFLFVVAVVRSVPACDYGSGGGYEEDLPVFSFSQPDCAPAFSDRREYRVEQPIVRYRIAENYCDDQSRFREAYALSRYQDNQSRLREAYLLSQYRDDSRLREALILSRLSDRGSVNPLLLARGGRSRSRTDIQVGDVRIREDVRVREPRFGRLR